VVVLLELRFLKAKKECRCVNVITIRDRDLCALNAITQFLDAAFRQWVGNFIQITLPVHIAQRNS
jgi:hypothetical protein